MAWYLVSEPNTSWEPINVADGDVQHVRDVLGRRFKYTDFTNGVNKRIWFQMAPPPGELGCLKFDCPRGGQHEWDEEPVPVTSRTGPVNICKKCQETEEDIRGELEAKWDGSVD